MKRYQIVLNTLKVSKTDEMETKDDLVDKRISKRERVLWIVFGEL